LQHAGLLVAGRDLDRLDDAARPHGLEAPLDAGPSAIAELTAQIGAPAAGGAIDQHRTGEVEACRDIDRAADAVHRDR